MLTRVAARWWGRATPPDAYGATQRLSNETPDSTPGNAGPYWRSGSMV